jgi:hypothetical protein
VAGYNGLVTVAAVVNPNTILRDNHDGTHFTAEADNIITAQMSFPSR